MRCCPAQAFAFIGGPEHCAYAKVKGAELRAVVNCVDRGNVYYCAAKGQEPTDTDWPSYFKGKTIATSGFGGTPNSITRYLLKKWNLDATSDVTLVEMANSAILARGQRQTGADRHARPSRSSPRACAPACGASRSSISRRSMGPYAYSTFNVRLDTIQKDPELVRGFVRGMMKSLKFVHDNHDEAAEIAKKQFPTMALDDLKATLARSFADDLWSQDGTISPAAWDTAKVRGDGRRHPQDRRQIRRDHRHELRRTAWATCRCSESGSPIPLREGESGFDSQRCGQRNPSASLRSAE